MAKVMIHATVSLDGFMADSEGGSDWMSGFPVAAEDRDLVAGVMAEVGAVVGGANQAQTIEDDEMPYGGTLGVPVFLMTHRPHEPIEKDGVTYAFVVDDIEEAVGAAKRAAGGKSVSLLGGSIARQCLTRGLVDEIQLHVVPILLGEGISLFAGLGRRVDVERVETVGFAGEAHLRYRVRS
ncbi:dihydrofolate reductase family protein [Isoptericola sp. NEAU-Y5]|uniref:Dihydrofolate reductase family protein n=1 Tax=Isoptericola luteus TaxID=2879484 RepID=A0ABS7ZF08_9MICO|nr:dihydrofolate reductase family protein [Isoptericola sp. NEAU-Y5]MCA5893626.1 dihydrofolate reductase family protein [Isoptericola sp. NEAU-Y5]